MNARNNGEQGREGKEKVVVGGVSVQEKKKNTIAEKVWWSERDRREKGRRGRSWGGKMSVCHFLPFPLIIPPQEGGGRRWVGRNDIFICSFKGSLLSPFKPSLSPFLSLRLILCSVAPTIELNGSFRSFSLFSFPCRSPSSLALSLSLFCCIIARLINYKGNSNSEKSSWNFRLQWKEPIHTHTPNNRFSPLSFSRIFVTLPVT